ncbi:MAG: helix-turn-helix transcriptional regulator [Sphingobacteriales bacterium]|nr:helix-turn-helix transcriptional regulator [Sphingobacteriales bacterium]OJW01970.1 MAG: hypothetical protein BGO52_00360 [Sphingobacteriales bacterium 44-61]
MNAPLTIITREGTTIVRTPEVPDQLFLKIPHAHTQTTIWEYGEMVEQYIVKKNAGFYAVSFTIKEITAFTVEASQPHAVLQYTLSGEATSYMKDGRFIMLLPGTYMPVKVPAGKHLLWLVPGRYDYLYFLLPEDHLHEMTGNHPSLAKISVQTIRPNNLNSSALRLRIPQESIHLINQLEELNPAESDLYLELQTITISLLKLLDAQLRNKNDLLQFYADLTDDIRNYILDNIEDYEKISIQSLKERFHISERTLERQFQKKFDQSLRNYIRNKRLERALLILSIENNSVSEVASRLGYYDVYSFSKIFTDQYGYSPKNINRILF